MLLLLLLLGAVQAAPPAEPELPVLKANIGSCSADFVVRDEVGAPVYNALVHVLVRYGPLNVKRADLEVGTNSAGKARFEGLPNKARLLVYEVQKDKKKASVQQNVSDTCRAMFDVTLK